MALVINDRVKETSTTTGTGTLNLAGASQDFISFVSGIGTGNTTSTNYPNVDENSAAQGQETNIVAPGRIYFVSTDQGGNFRVGEYFSVNQLTGAATLDASAFNLSGLTELRLGAIGGQIGEAINEFSSDETLSGDSNLAVPTEKATRGFLTRGKMDATSGIMVPPVSYTHLTLPTKA